MYCKNLKSGISAAVVWDILSLCTGGVSVPPCSPLCRVGPHKATQLSGKRLNGFLHLIHWLSKYPGLGPDQGPGTGFGFSDSIGNGTAILATRNSSFLEMNTQPGRAKEARHSLLYLKRSRD